MSYVEIKTDIEVVLLSQKYQTTKNYDGSQSGTRVYHEASYHPNSAGKIVYLPDQGDSWSVEAPDLKVVTIEQTYLQDRTECGRLWTLNYTNIDMTYSASGGEEDPEATANEKDFRTSIELGVENVTFEVNAGVWKWYDTDLPCSNKVIPVPVSISTIKLYRTIYGTQLWAFNEMDFFAHGKCNKGLFYNIPSWMLLYRGANLLEKKGEFGERIWDAELIFDFRSVTGNFVWGEGDLTDGGLDGWNWIVREDKDMAKGMFGKQYYIDNAGNKQFLYKSTSAASLKDLLIVGGPAIKFPDLAWMK